MLVLVRRKDVMCSSGFLSSPLGSRGVGGEEWLQLQSLTSWLHLTYSYSAFLVVDVDVDVDVDVLDPGSSRRHCSLTM